MLSDLVISYDAIGCHLSWYGVASGVAATLAVGVYIGCKIDEIQWWLKRRGW